MQEKFLIQKFKPTFLVWKKSLFILLPYLRQETLFSDANITLCLITSLPCFFNSESMSFFSYKQRSHVYHTYRPHTTKFHTLFKTSMPEKLFLTLLIKIFSPRQLMKTTNWQKMKKNSNCLRWTFYIRHTCSFEKEAENYMYLNLSVQSYDSVNIVLLLLKVHSAT